METNTSVNYRAWGADNIAYGPMELPSLVAWIKQGKVTATTWVFKEMDGAWSRASDLPELKVLFKSKLPPGTAASAGAGIQPGSLRRIKMLADVDERLLASLLAYLEVVKVPPFGTVVNKGDLGDAFFLVLEGEVRARVLLDGRESTLATMGVGECFGELAIVDQGPRSADVIANQPSILIKVSAGALKKMFTEAPALAAPFMFALTRVIAQRVRVLTKRYEDSIQFSRSGGPPEQPKKPERPERPEQPRRKLPCLGTSGGVSAWGWLALAASTSPRHPDRDADKVHGLVEPHRNRARFRRLAALLENPNPPRHRQAGVEQEVDDRQHQPTLPAQGQAKARRVYAGMRPGGRMSQTPLVARHPVVLQNPVRHQVRHQASFERREDHSHFVGPGCL
jgi:CRP-like cAMP-binding protein